VSIALEGFNEFIHPETKWHRMSLDVLRKIIWQAISQGTRKINFGRQGGEPTLMGPDFSNNLFTYRIGLAVAKLSLIVYKFKAFSSIKSGLNISAKTIFSLVSALMGRSIFMTDTRNIKTVKARG